MRRTETIAITTTTSRSGLAIPRLVIVLLFQLLPFALKAGNNDTLYINTSANCSMCKKNIEAALRFEPGVKRAVLDLETKKLMVIYQSGKTNPEKLRLAVSKSGYDADQIPADSSAYRKLEPCCQKGGH